MLDHNQLLPRLMGMLAPGGVLAVQMPDNRDEPSHRLMREVAALQPWAADIGDPQALRTDLLTLNDYYDVLARDAQVDAWRTAYQHPMDSAEAIVQWVSGTGLRPFSSLCLPSCKPVLSPNTPAASMPPTARAAMAGACWPFPACFWWPAAPSDD